MEVEGARIGEPAVSEVPRLLVITDCDLSPTSRGAGRTLSNILSAWPPETARIVSTLPDSVRRDLNGHAVFQVTSGLPAGFRARLRPILGDLEAQWMRFSGIGLDALDGFSPERLLVVPSNPAALVLGANADAFFKVPSATWLMDDWIQQYPARWITGSADKTARKLLARNSGWLVISEYLGEELRRWTEIERPTHVVHNAVEIGEPPVALSSPRSGKFVLRYAGTVWPMHADALVLVARAVAARRAAGDDIEFVLHTDRRGWSLHEKVWQETGTVFGNIVPYESLRDTLADSDLLVVASSFAKEHERMTKSSVQTKITDYLASGRTILNVGPADGACARFLRERDIAVYIDSPDVPAAALTLGRLVNARASLGEVAARGWEVVKRDHEIGAVGRATAKFLAELGAWGAWPKSS
jgi:glycosyltransferase involved in cell wall biosynthesis